MIIISGHYRGPELKTSRISNAIRTAMKSMSKARAEAGYENTLGAVPHVNAVFIVEGSFGHAAINYIRIGAYSNADKCVQVDIPLSASEADAQNLRDILVFGLRAANANAFHFFDDKGMEFRLREAEDLVTKVGEDLEAFA